MKKHIVFVDSTYPEAYDSSDIERKALGGTESSVIRTAQILSQHFKVSVLQKSRQRTTEEGPSLTFAPLSLLDQISADVIVVLRKYPIAIKLSQRFSNVVVFLWIHTYKNHEFVFKRAGLAKSKITIICNSLTHQKHTDRKINGGFLGRMASVFWKKIAVNYCYNPIPYPPELTQQKNKNKLLFFSSPNKGLKQILKCFYTINAQLPDLQLFIANPGYKKSQLELAENTVILGSLPHKEMMKHVQQSLCVFYPQDSFAETFGLIYAEANAYGVPVLGHDIGSAREILDDNNNLVDVNDCDQVIQMIKRWQNNYPQVSYNQKFSAQHIIKQWMSML